MKLFGRDELRVKSMQRSSHGTDRTMDECKEIKFKHQFSLSCKNGIFKRTIEISDC